MICLQLPSPQARAGGYQVAQATDLYDDLKGSYQPYVDEFFAEGVTEEQLKSFLSDLDAELRTRALNRSNFDEQMLAALAKVAGKGKHDLVRRAILEVAGEIGDVFEMIAGVVPEKLKPLRDAALERFIGQGAGTSPGGGALVTLPEAGQRAWFGTISRHESGQAEFFLDPAALRLGSSSGWSHIDLRPYAPQRPVRARVILPVGSLRSRIQEKETWLVRLDFPGITLTASSRSLLEAFGGREDSAAIIEIQELELEEEILMTDGAFPLVPLGRGYWVSAKGAVEVTLGYEPGPDPCLVGVYQPASEGPWRYLGGRCENGSVSLAVSTFPASMIAAECRASFSDAAGHWAENIIKRMALRGVVRGLGGGTFGPDASLTRAQMAVLVQRILQLPGDLRAASSFDDVSPGSWYAEAVGALHLKSAAAGSSGRLFRPEEPATREEFITALVIAMGSEEFPGSKALLPFLDFDEASAWARLHLTRAAWMGLIEGRGEGKLEPASLVTRAEATTIVSRAIEAGAFSRNCDSGS